jgi:beta-galactosidase GanA
MKAMTFLLALFLLGATAEAAAGTTPWLRQQGTATQLMVDDHPFLVLGGELHNSSASSLAYLDSLWPALKAAEVNTILAPVEWDQIEPVEGSFDFTVLDGMLGQARAHGTRVILLWFGAWKNSMSTYAPAWVKRDQQRFPRVRSSAGVAQEILTPFGARTLAADAAAFRALLAHLRQTDTQRTVLMVQVENEIGMLPDARDHGPLADAALAGQVPRQLMDYLQAHRDALHPALQALWKAGGQRASGSWTDVFGAGSAAEEVFQAWAYASFVQTLAAAGKSAYPLPMYVNAALNRPGKKPGEYPSAGPLPHLFDVWKAGAPSIDVLAIDSYFPNFTDWAPQFKRTDNPLFVPEADNAGRHDAAAKAFYAIGEHDAFGFSPFGIEDSSGKGDDTLPAAYRLLKQLAPVIATHQGSGNMRGFKARVSYDGVVDSTPQQVVMGSYALQVGVANQFDKAGSKELESRGGLVIRLSGDEFLVAGKGLTVVFKDAAVPGSQVGIEQATEGEYRDGAWQPGRWLNGDETHQGRQLMLRTDRFSIQRVRLYRYR